MYANNPNEFVGQFALAILFISNTLLLYVEKLSSCPSDSIKSLVKSLEINLIHFMQYFIF